MSMMLDIIDAEWMIGFGCVLAVAVLMWWAIARKINEVYKKDDKDEKDN
jgi:hypothetical protein